MNIAISCELGHVFLLVIIKLLSFCGDSVGGITIVPTVDSELTNFPLIDDIELIVDFHRNKPTSGLTNLLNGYPLIVILGYQRMNLRTPSRHIEA